MRQSGFRTFSTDSFPVAEALLGGWVLLDVEQVFGLAGKPLVRVEIKHHDAEIETLGLYLVATGRYHAVFFVNLSVVSLQVHAYGALSRPERVFTRPLRPINSLQAALKTLKRPGALRRLLSRPLLLSPSGWKSRLHAVEAVTIADLTVSYAEWLNAFGTWPVADKETLRTQVELLVFSPAPGLALDATLSSVGDLRSTIIGPDDDWQEVVARRELSRDIYVGIVGAGEVLVPHAIDTARRLLVSKGLPAIAIADEDRLEPSGRRISPAFKPEPNHVLMLSGTLCHGLWLIRGDVLVSACPQISPGGYAELARLDIWLSLWRQKADPGKRLPVVLTSRRLDAPVATPESVAGLVDDHLKRASLPLRAIQGWPVRLHAQSTSLTERVTALVPSTLRAPHAERCLTAILRGAEDPGLDMIVAVSQPDPLDDLQLAVASRLEMSGARVIHFEEPCFNFSRTINLAARETTATRLLLLNDDVSPLAPGWLATMCAFLAIPDVGVVGARLCYPDGRLQHAGVIIGLAGLCEHAFRFQRADTPGYEWRAQLPQRLSAVTGACMLVRAEAWKMVGGMDETYPSAFNDVDFCLRVNEAGREIVLSDALLVHHELQTYGSHFAGERAAFEKLEVARMRARWSKVVKDDPFYSPNLSLIPEYAWTPTLPPRL